MSVLLCVNHAFSRGTIVSVCSYGAVMPIFLTFVSAFDEQ